MAPDEYSQMIRVRLKQENEERVKGYRTAVHRALAGMFSYERMVAAYRAAPPANFEMEVLCDLPDDSTGCSI